MVRLVAKVDERGRVTIPAAIRDQLGINGEGEVLVDVAEGGAVELLVRGGIEDDPLWKILEEPLEVNPEIIRKTDVEKMREEVWAGELP